MGCVFYYVLSKGKHAFGDSLHRQANILSGTYDLSFLEDDEYKISRLLIERMIHFNPLNRPSANAVLQHPIFWKKSKVLTFFQDVSDRIEKEDINNFVVQKLEENSLSVVKGDWCSQIDEELAKDLKKFRGYHGRSVRDLLRALRNKKHHYRELSEEARKSLGEVPENFLTYWTSRFPLLLIHTWLALQCVKDEPVFANYYDNKYNFPNMPKQNFENHSHDILVDSTHDFVEALIEIEFPRKKNWKLKDSPVQENWRNDSSCLELSKTLDFKSCWFQKWFASNFRDDKAYIKWREEEFINCKSETKDGKAFIPEPPTLEICEMFRSKAIEYSKMNFSPKKNKSKRFFQKKYSKKQDNGVVWKLPT